MSDNLLFNLTDSPHPYKPFIAYKTEAGDIQYVQPNPDGELWKEFLQRFAEEAEREFFSLNPGVEKVLLEDD